MLTSIVEDPNFRDSRHSYFVQSCDLAAFLLYQNVQPNAYIRNAQEVFKQFDGWWVVFETKKDSYTIKRADLKALDEYQKREIQQLNSMKTRFDLSVTKLAGLNDQRANSVLSYGTKSANLGEVMHYKLNGIVVPNGFTIPFYYYDQFIKENKIDDTIYGLLEDKKVICVHLHC